MPYQIPGQPGTWYEPGTRNGNATIAWRGYLPDGRRTEFFTDSTTRAGAEAFRRRYFEQWYRDNPPVAGAQVDLATVARHYKDARARSDVERDRIDRVVDLIGGQLAVHFVNQTHLTAAAKAFKARRAADNARAEREGLQTYPLPTTPTINREITTPLRTLLNFATEQSWRPKVVLRALKPAEGELPSQPRPAARDQDVARLLRTITKRLDGLAPVGDRKLNLERHAASLKAIRALVLLVHERGYRISEWLRWDWETVDLQAGAARILLSKPDRWADFSMSPEAVSALVQMGARDSGRVFPWGHRSQVYQAVDRLGIHWRPHESRRAVVTALIQETGDPVFAQNYVGHANVKTTLRYRVVGKGETHSPRRGWGDKGRQ
jgi:integrase